MSVQGVADLKKRVKAIKLTFKVYGRSWADDTAQEMRGRVPVASGRLRRSIRRKSATQRKAVVAAHYTANFVDAGSREHDILPKRGGHLIFESGGRTIFARKVHKQRIGPRRFKRPSALAALAKHPMSETMIDLWNKAA